MRCTDLQYTVRAIAGKVLVELKELSIEGLERTVEVVINGELVGKITLMIQIYPQLMITDSYVTIWGGTRIFVFPLANKACYQLHWDDEVHYIFSIDSLWCIVGEVSIVLYDISSQQEVNRYDHLEIILEAFLFDSQLNIVDLANNKRKFQIVNRALIPINN